ncbi:MAG: two-component regulator propeller domain-containing protein [Saprospiraceae bacterium]
METPCQFPNWLLSLAIVTLTCAGAFAQSSNLQFKLLTRKDGLPSSSARCLLQDRHGYIWIGTGDGLARFDGYHFTVYKNDPDDDCSLSDNCIMDLFEDSQGKLWIGTLSGGLNSFDSNSEEFQRYQHHPSDSLSLSNDGVTDISEDHEGYIWVGTYAGGLNRLDKKTGLLKRYLNNPNDSLSLKGNWVTIVFEDSTKDLWVGTYYFGLARFDREKEQFHYVFKKDKAVDKTWGKYYINGVYIDKEHKFWMASDMGIYHFDPATWKYELYFLPNIDNPNIHLNTNNDLSVDPSGFLWFAGIGGISRFDPVSKASVSFLSNQDYTWGLPNANAYFCSLVDREGILWVGTDKGLLRQDRLQDRFRNYPLGPHHLKGLNNNSITYIQEDSEGILWINSENGLHRIDPMTGQHILYEHQSQDPSTIWRNEVYNMLEIGDGIFLLSIVDHGLELLNKSSGKFHYIGTKGINAVRYIRCICKDREGVIWLATWAGVMQFNPKTENFLPVLWKSDNNKGRKWTDANVIFEDSRGTLWFGTLFGELKTYDRSSGTFHEYLPDRGIRYGKAAISLIYEDTKGILWIGTGEGLKRFDPKTKIFTTYGTNDGLANNNVSGILEDGHENLWISTMSGLSRFNPKTKKFLNFDLTDGLPSVEFSGGFFKSKKSGFFYFGTPEGLVAFHPDSIEEDSFIPPVYITGFTYFNTKKGTVEPIKAKGIVDLKEVTVSYFDNILTFQFTALSYRKTAKNQYAYQLEGFSNKWIPLGTKREITFTNLDPGTYTLRVKGSNGDGIWNKSGASLKIIITPPWWRTWWAYIGYFLSAGGLLFAIYRFQLGKQLEHAENIRLKELDTFKTRLYTNITHEFRTPLTVISGMADQIREDPKRWLEDGVQTIQRNSSQLLRLVNQMLDLRKLESGNMPLNMVQGDIIVYLKYLVESFHSQAEAKDIDLYFGATNDELVMDYDAEKLQQIMANLLSNAMKFTGAGGEVGVLAQPVSIENTPCLRISVTDNGIGIPAEKVPFIFNRFYQADDSHTRPGEGTGIGLALTKELTGLLGGQISVESKVGQGTVFNVLLPVKKTASTPAGDRFIEIEKPILNSKNNGGSQTVFNVPVPGMAGGSGQPQILLIEDNHDVVKYLSAFLEGNYHLSTAANGQEGIDKAIETIPDLIVSDIMMPLKDGFEVCQTLKNDDRTSHIPIILLTAKADAESRLQGLDCGADAYLSKPFDKKELLVRIRKLLELRQKLQEHYLAAAIGQEGLGETGRPSAARKKEDAFVEKVKAIVTARMSDPQFGTSELGREVGMSRSQLHRKMTALTGLPPNRFIRMIRLEKARILMLETEENIGEIAYDTGFNDPGYFTRVFTQTYGMAPSEFRGKVKG